MSDPKTQRLNLRVGSVDRALFGEAASLREESLSEFLVESGRERAERVLADRTSFVLDDKQWSAFNAALDRPAEARPDLAQLFTRPRPE